MISKLGDQDGGDSCLRWFATFDEARFGRHLNEATLAFATSIAGASGHNHAELGGNDVELLAHIFTDDMAPMTAGTCGVAGFDDLFNTWLMFGQGPARLAF